MQGRQLDRDPGAVEHPGFARLRRQRRNGARISLEVALCVGACSRRLAQHVVRETDALGLEVAGPRHGLFHGPPHYELAAQDAHRLDHRLADHGLAGFCHRSAQEVAHVAKLVVAGQVHHPAREHQGPGGGVDEERFAPAQMAMPVGLGDLVADQAVGGVGVGNPQQGLGQAHEDDTLLVGKPVLVEEGFDAALAAPHRPHPAHQRGGALLHAPVRAGPATQLGQKGDDAGGFVGPVGGFDRQPLGIGLREVTREGHGAPAIRASFSPRQIRTYRDPRRGVRRAPCR